MWFTPCVALSTYPQRECWVSRRMHREERTDSRQAPARPCGGADHEGDEATASVLGEADQATAPGPRSWMVKRCSPTRLAFSQDRAARGRTGPVSPRSGYQQPEPSGARLHWPGKLPPHHGCASLPANPPMQLTPNDVVRLAVRDAPSSSAPGLLRPRCSSGRSRG